MKSAGQIKQEAADSGYQTAVAVPAFSGNFRDVSPLDSAWR